MKKSFLILLGMAWLAAGRCLALEPGAAAPVAEISLPVNQILSPAGTQVDLGDTRPQVIALSPDGKLLATGSKHSLVLLDARKGSILQTVPMPRDNLKVEEPGTVSEQILHQDSAAE